MFILNLVVGVIGGIIGGMGMGGGTLLIPLLTLICGVAQHSAQAVNLLSFLPMSIVALIIHAKNKLIEFKSTWIIMLVGSLFCVLGSIIAKNMEGDLLGRLFGAFLILLSIFQFISGIKKTDKH